MWKGFIQSLYLISEEQRSCFPGFLQEKEQFSFSSQAVRKQTIIRGVYTKFQTSVL